MIPPVTCRVFGDPGMDPQIAPPDQCCYSRYLTVIGREEQPPDDLADLVIENLTAAVRRHIRSTRWHVSPRRFGFDQQTWADHFSTENYPDVVVAYYLYLFGNEAGDNCDYLLGKVEAGQPIGGLVEHLLVSRFLFALQSENDPIGYAVYTNVHGAVTCLLADGKWEAQHPRRNDTPVRVRGRTDPVAEEPEIALALQKTRALHELPKHPSLLSKLGKRSRPAQRELQSHLSYFPKYGVGAFTTRTVNDCLREPVRAAVYRSNALPVEYDPEMGVYQLFRTAVPDWSPDSPADLHAKCLSLLRRLREQVNTGQSAILAIVCELIRLLERGEPIPSGADLGRRLSIDRRRVSELLTELTCRSARLPELD